MVFKKILVALDRSSQTEIVFKKALEIAETQASQLMLCHCLDLQAEEISPWMGIGTLSDVNMYSTSQRLHHESLQKDLEQIKNWLQNYCQQAMTKNITAEYYCRVGNPQLSICSLARDWGADLIIMGRRGNTGLSELLLGSVSNYVTHHAACSVLIIQGIKSVEIEQFSTVKTKDTSRL